MSLQPRSSKSLVRESLKILDENVDDLINENESVKNSKKSSSTKNNFLLQKSSVKEIENVKKQIKEKQNLAQNNLKKLKLLSQNLKEKTAKRILDKVGHSSDIAPESAKKPKIEETVFTEEDFLKFEREYFVY